MNYDTQYAFSHNLASTPQIQALQQCQPQFHQQQQPQIFQPQQQPQYGQMVPTSNVYFQFTRGGGGTVFQQKDLHQVALAPGGMPQAQGVVAPSIVKQGVPVRMEGNCVHLIGSSDGMIYPQQQQQPDLKILSAPTDSRILQHSQLDASLGLSQNVASTILGIDVVGNQTSHLKGPTIDFGQSHAQNPGTLTMAGQGTVLSYNKHQFPSPWLPQQQISNSTGNLQQHPHRNQNALPSFTHLWSQFQQQKNQSSLGHQQNTLTSFQQTQQIQNHLQQFQQQAVQQQALVTDSGIQAFTSVQMVSLPHFHDQSQQQSPLNVLSNQISCFSPCGASSTPSPCSLEKKVPNAECILPNTSIIPKAALSETSVCSTTISPICAAPSLLTDTSSVPPKVTVILDSLPHCETFPPTTHLHGNAVSAFKPKGSVASGVETQALSSKEQMLTSNHQRQKMLGTVKSIKHVSSTGSSTERSSSESSNFSSPPYAFTPPSDSLFSPGLPTFHGEELSLLGGLPETPSSICLSSSSLCSSTSPPTSSTPLSLSSASSSIPLSTIVSPLPSGSNTTWSSKMDKPSQPQSPTMHTNKSSITCVATALTLSSPSTTTVITAVASSSQLITTSTSSASVTLTSPCPKDKAVPGTTNTKLSCAERKVKVPFSWQRKIEDGVVVYISPSGTVLSSFDEICQYLLSANTCKCGLECPIQVEQFFSFDAKVGSIAWSLEAENDVETEVCDGGKVEKHKQADLRKLCNHRRELLALAAFHNSQSQVEAESLSIPGHKRDRRASLNGGDGLIMSPLKRIRTSITNAVNKHASSTRNKKNNLKEMGECGGQISSSPSPSTDHSENSTIANLSNSFFLSHSVVSKNGGNEAEPEFKVDDILIQGTLPSASNETLTSVAMDSVLAGQVKAELSCGGDVDMLSPEVKVETGSWQTKCEPIKDSMALQTEGRSESSCHQSAQISLGSERKGDGSTATASAFTNQVPSSPGLKQVTPIHTPPAHGSFPLHSTPISVQSSHTTQLPLGLPSPKSKSKRSRSNRDKHRVASNSATSCDQGTKLISDDLTLPTSTVSFMENPTVFVAQQTAIINKSIASCNIACSSPGPVTEPSQLCSKWTTTKLQRKREPKVSIGCKNNNFEGLKDKMEITEEQKIKTDKESSQPPSDQVENDSAYVSHLGSDQERSDTIDGLDTSLGESKSSDIYDFSFSEDQEGKLLPNIVHVSVSGEDSTEKVICKAQVAKSGCKPHNAQTESVNVSSKEKVPSMKNSHSKSKTRPRILSSPMEIKPRNGLIDGKMDKEDSISFHKELNKDLNRELSNLLASDNWNIPAVQQVLAQYSGGDPGQLNAAIQHVLAQASGAVTELPTSNSSLTSALKIKPIKEEGACINKPVNGLSNLPHMTQAVVGKDPQKASIRPDTTLSNFAASNMKQSGTQLDVAPSFGGGKLDKSGASTTQEVKKGNLKSTLSLKEEPSKTATNTFVQVNASNSLSICSAVNKPQATQQVMVRKLGVSLAVASTVHTPSCPSVSLESNNQLGRQGSPRTIINPQSTIPVTVSMITSCNVSKTLSQIAIGLSSPQLSCSQQQPTPILASTQQLGAPITNPSHHQVVSATGSAGGTLAPVLPTANNNGPQQFVAGGTSQIMNGLPVQSLCPNQQQQVLLQQVSPCPPLSQLSPAMAAAAAQILSQTPAQQQQQMSPSSFLTSNTLQKQQTQNSILASQAGLIANVSLPTLSFSAGNTLSTSLQQPQQQRPANISGIPGILNAPVETSDQLAQGLSQVKDITAAASLTNASMFAAAPQANSQQPVFVLPQANANPVVHVLGGTDLQQHSGNNLAAQLFSQQQQQPHQSQNATTIDTGQLQNLLAASFNPLSLQQTLNTVNINGVQQQQQLQMLQLQQQLMLQQQLQSQQQGLSVPGPQTNPPQAAIVNAVMSGPSLQLGSVLDVNSIQPNLAAATAHLRMATSLPAQPSIMPAGNVLQNTGLQKVFQTPIKPIPGAVTSLPQLTAPAAGNVLCTPVTHTQLGNGSSQILSAPAPQVVSQPTKLMPSSAVTPTSSCTTTTSNSISPATTLTSAASYTSSSTATSNTKCSNSGVKPKSKSKSKKSENKKVIDPEAERKEEDIVATVQQILAQAVQQQRELNLAAKNQPPPPPKSKSKKSQSRAKAAYLAATVPPIPTPGHPHSTISSSAGKEHDLGKLPSIISDDVVMQKPGMVNSLPGTLSNNPLVSSGSSAVSSKLTQPSVSPCTLPQPFPGVIRLPSQALPISNQQILLSSTSASSSACMAKITGSLTDNSSHVPSHKPSHINKIEPSQCLSAVNVENPPACNIGSDVNTASSTPIVSGASNSNTSKKSAISLKDHLSSIISKDSKKSSSNGTTVRYSKVKVSGNTIDKSGNHVMSVGEEEAGVMPKALRKSVK